MTQICNTDWLRQLPRLQGKPGLHRMKALMDKLGNPQNQMDFVHVAGTNGKGTVATLTANILKSAGYKTGLTISPYVVDFRERFQINGEMISAQELERLAGQVRKAADALPEQPAQFEAVTALALLYFCENGCDIAVLETGLGGKYDATNIVTRTRVAAITRIDLDHTELLGDTLEQIAGEKAGIIKPSCTVVCYPMQDHEAQQMIVAECIRQKAELVQPAVEDIEILQTEQPLQNSFSYGGYQVQLPLLGAHQACNATMAIEIALALWRNGYEIEDQAILDGLEQASFPARLEVLQKEPLILLDGAHNPAGIAALAGCIKHTFRQKPVAVLGVMQDKAVEEMIKILAPNVRAVYAVTPKYSARAMSAERLAELARKYMPEQQVVVFEELEQALRCAQGEPFGAVICGSLYLAAEAREILMDLLKK